jgi:FkbM family methyltransferase
MNNAFDTEQTLQAMRHLWNGQVPHEEDFKYFQQLFGTNRRVTLLDCGANAGQSAISFLMNCPKGRVISFEPNLIYQPVLAGVQSLLGAERFEFHMEGMADEETVQDLYIPYVDGIPYLQEATMKISQFDKPWVADRLRSYGEILEIKNIKAHFVVADSKNLKVDAIKIDAEGAEMLVLRGMRKTILECKPVLLIENNDWLAVTEFLNVIGYKPYQWHPGSNRLAEMSGPSTNCFYLLEEHYGIQSVFQTPGGR